MIIVIIMIMLVWLSEVKTISCSALNAQARPVNNFQSKLSNKHTSLFCRWFLLFTNFTGLMILMVMIINEDAFFSVKDLSCNK